jgi:hypothetical protein
MNKVTTKSRYSGVELCQRAGEVLRDERDLWMLLKGQGGQIVDMFFQLESEEGVHVPAMADRHIGAPDIVCWYFFVRSQCQQHPVLIGNRLSIRSQGAKVL